MTSLATAIVCFCVVVIVGVALRARIRALKAPVYACGHVTDQEAWKQVNSSVYNQVEKQVNSSVYNQVEKQINSRIPEWQP